MTTVAEHLDSARTEVVSSTQEDIDERTAAVWGARAVAAYERFHQTKKLSWFAAAVEYHHEAREHAAGGPPGTVERIEKEIQALIPRSGT